MGNCTGYCNGCTENGTKFDVNQIRNSVKDNDMMMNEKFGGNQGYNGGTFNNDEDGYENN